ncbi:calcium-binding protein [Phaeobacter marinintestinus]|uniref:calcium-binding protein n=1 Tax=Falsiphaeobacter marinintestinus TaxID=1492905 RepID=UPI0011B35EEA|nr:calcium-binding protein [Phaeobacter marinintestinus]
MPLFNGTFATDRIFGSNVNDTINGRRGDDSLYGQGGNDTIRGDEGNDWMDGGDGNDRIFGGDDEDYLYGGVGNDILNGGTGGTDYDYVYYYGDVGVTVNLALGTATDEFGGTDTLIDIEYVHASSGADTLIGGNAANDGWESFRGYAGNDFIDGGSGFDRADYARDYNSNDGSGSLGIIADLAAGTVRDGFGDTDTIVNIEVIRASIFSDDLRGDGNDNWFNPLTGSDYIDGRGGIDEVSYNSDNYYEDRSGFTGIEADLARGQIVDTSGYQIDTVVNIENVRGSVWDDDIRGDAGANRLRGDDGDDFLTGRNGNDRLEGGNGNDALVGGLGADSLKGGAGNDDLWGRQGNDVFVFEVGGDVDSVRDFRNNQDMLDVSDYGFAAAADVIAAASQFGSDVLIDLGGDDMIVLENFRIANLDASDLII